MDKKPSTNKGTLPGPEAKLPAKRKMAPDNDVSPDPPRTKKRRTRSYRNKLLKGSLRIPPKKKSEIQPEIEPTDIDLGPEVDRLLEEKALKNNLTVTNVKSIIREVVTNNMVQKMMMATLRRERKMATAAAGGGGGDTAKSGNMSPGEEDDEDLFHFEPKLTRSKAKELSEIVPSALWLSSPMKLLQPPPPTEAQRLIHCDYPEDEEDDEYIPEETELRAMGNSDDEGHSNSTFTSDVGSPAQAVIPSPSPNPPEEVVSFKKAYLTARYYPREKVRKVSGNKASQVQPSDSSVFKTPEPPKEKWVDTAISLRTRSKHPLNDTPLEHLEMQLVPPDITTDMYDFSKPESENEDYLAFLKEFAFTGRSAVAAEEEEEEGDPDFNVMDNMEENDKEEHRVDRAVKVTKKELNDLVAELFDFDDLSFGEEDGDDIDGGDLTELRQDRPFISKSIKESQQRALYQAGNELEVQDSAATSSSIILPLGLPQATYEGSELAVADPKDSSLAPEPSNVVDVVTSPEPEVIPEPETVLDPTSNVRPEAAPVQLFTEEFRDLLKNQLSQHIQLLAQSYLVHLVLPEGKNAVQCVQVTHDLITDLWNRAVNTGENSTLFAYNLKPAMELLHKYPKKIASTSPIKKKILEEQYMNFTLSEFAFPIPNWIAQIICESPVFMHSQLLPAHKKTNKPTTTKQGFLPDEDALIARGLKDLSDTGRKMKLSHCANILASTLLNRCSTEIYYRIRNIKSNLKCNKDNPLRHYIRNKELQPPPHIPIPLKPVCPLAPCKQIPNTLSPVWARIILRIDLRNQKYRLCQTPSKHGLQIPNYSSPGKLKRTKSPRSTDTVVRSPKAQVPVSIVKPIPRPKGSPKPSPLKETKKNNSSARKNNTNCIMKCSIRDMNATAAAISHTFNQPLVHVVQASTTKPILSLHLAPNHESRKENVQAHEGQGRTPVGAHASRRHLTLNNSAGPSTTDSHSSPIEHVKDGTQRSRHPDSSSSEEGECSDSLDEEEQNNDKIERKVFSNDNKSPRSLHDDALSETIDQVDLCSSEEESMANEGDENKNSAGDTSSHNEQHLDSANTSDNNVGVEGTTPVASSGDNGVAGTSRSTGGNGNEDGDDEDRRRRQMQRSSGSSEAATKSTEETDEETDNKKRKINFDSPTLPSNGTSAGRFGSTGSPSPPRVGPSSGKPASKKVKKSPTHSNKYNTTAKRASKYNTATSQQLLMEDCDEDPAAIEVNDTSVDTFLSRVQHRVGVDGKNPSLSNTVVQILCDYDPSTESSKDLFLKMEEVLKDYPDLVAQLAAFIMPEEALSVGRFVDHQHSLSEVHFVQLLEKWTQSCPQLKARIMQKYAALREETNLTEEKIATVMEPFFSQSPVMMEAFKAMFNLVYRPPSNPADFEILDLDTAEDKDDRSGCEVINLPDESCVPATHTCQCDCHSNTSSTPYLTRIKHCSKCCLKFHDGKLYTHSGRIMKSLNVEFTTPEIGREIVSGSACITCLKPKPSTPPSTATPTSPPCPASKPWTRDEDCVLLTVYHAEQEEEVAVEKIMQQIGDSQRTPEEIKSRFKVITSFLREMVAGAGADTEPTTPNISPDA